MKLFNTATRSLEEFTPINKQHVGVYSCGPTVYYNQHIGHMYAYVQWDVLVRTLRYVGYPVEWVMNITDVGHLTSDEDVGEDKMEKGAKREGLTVWEIADKYIAQFMESLSLLNIQLPNVLTRATDHIPEQIALIEKIDRNGFAYKTKTGLVFDTAKFPDYARFACLDLTKQAAGARVEVDPEKRQPWDFLLWVTNQPEHIMKWASPWGVGFPGWHIECTAMSTKYLGERFDIHTGGKEHIPVHHSNEIAQGFAAFGHQTANYWLHNEWLLVGNEKMSKSGGNIVTAQDLVTRGYNPLALRYLILTSHYQQGLNFSWEALDAAQSALRRLNNVMAEFRDQGDQRRTVLSEEKLQKINEYRRQFTATLENNLALPQAMALVWAVVKSNITSEDKYDLLVDFDQVLGLKLAEAKLPEEKLIPDEIQKLADKREVARKDNQWSQADTIRKQIEDLGFMAIDTAGGTIIKRK
jgi:cysteinyl-tRNA synthetase